MSPLYAVIGDARGLLTEVAVAAEVVVLMALMLGVFAVLTWRRRQSRYCGRSGPRAATSSPSSGSRLA